MKLGEITKPSELFAYIQMDPNPDMDAEFADAPTPESPLHALNLLALCLIGMELEKLNDRLFPPKAGDSPTIGGER